MRACSWCPHTGTQSLAFDNNYDMTGTASTTTINETNAIKTSNAGVGGGKALHSLMPFRLV